MRRRFLLNKPLELKLNLVPVVILSESPNFTFLETETPSHFVRMNKFEQLNHRFRFSLK